MAILPRHRPVALGRPTLDRVLCAVDAGRASADAIREALALAPCATRLGFITITDTLETGSDRIASLAAHRARQTLESALALASARALAAETELVRAASVVDALLARATMADLLVVGSRGDAPHPGAAGSVATALVARASGPLLVARSGAGAQGPHPRILVAVDDGAAAASLVALAGAIATACHGYVHLVHVQGRGYGAQTRHRLAELSTALIEQTGSEPVVDVARAANVAAHVCQLAHDSSSSLLVVGRPGPATRRGLGAIAERILHGAPCSVLVGPTPAA
ncbi:MAG: universal stress protein [Solirubrobacteraceae bacterium]|nr:universal stress protein [Solirubrobacteraceae bacterium]